MNKNKKFALYSLVALLTSTTITAFSLTDSAKAKEQTQAQLPRSAERGVDQEFLRQMTRHHQMATMMAGLVVNSAQHREIRNLAENIIESQSAEIAQMQQLLQAMNNRS